MMVTYVNWEEGMGQAFITFYKTDNYEILIYLQDCWDMFLYLQDN